MAQGKPVDPARLAIMISAIRHRGPDHQQVWTQENLGLAHARLSIVDLSAEANQPMWDVSKQFVIVFNGEIYNFKEIRTELKSLGHSFRTSSDTEVVLEAFKAWGLDCHRRFNGMWAFALWDTRNRTLVLSRDRFGVKPLFVAEDGEDLLFASEIKALLAAGVRAEVNRTALRWYLEDAGCDRRSMTMFSAIQSIPAGSYMVVDPGSRPKTVVWWETAENLVDVPGRFPERAELFRETFMDAVRIRLRTDTPTAVTLSSGLDSSSVLGAYCSLSRDGLALGATHEENRSLSSFVVSYPGEEIDEAPLAVALARKLGQEPQVVIPRPEDFRRTVEEVTWHQESLVWNGSVIAFHEVYRSIADHGIRVILEGHGSDEMLAGYPYFSQIAMDAFVEKGRLLSAWGAARAGRGSANRALDQQTPSPLAMVGRALFGGFRDGAVRVVKRAIPEGWTRSPSALTDAHHTSAFDGLFDPDFVGVLDPYPIPDAARSLSRLKQALYEAFHLRILPNVLRVFDRATMAHGIESRAPFMDYRLVQLAFSVPDTDIVSGGFTKRILREAVKDLLPPEVVWKKPKMGFAVALPTWFRHPAVYSSLQDALADGTISRAPGLDQRRFETLLAEGLRSGFTWANTTRLWQGFSYALWHDRFIARFAR